jgi:hypothetical protein
MQAAVGATAVGAGAAVGAGVGAAEGGEQLTELSVVGTWPIASLPATATDMFARVVVSTCLLACLGHSLEPQSGVEDLCARQLH